MKKVCLFITIGFMTSLSYARNCSDSAKSSVEGDIFSATQRVVVEVEEVDDDKMINFAVKLIKKSKDRKLRGKKKADLIADITELNPSYKYYIAITDRDSLYLAFVAPKSCAPFDPIFLGQLED